MFTRQTRYLPDPSTVGARLFDKASPDRIEDREDLSPNVNIKRQDSVKNPDERLNPVSRYYELLTGVRPIRYGRDGSCAPARGASRDGGGDGLPATQGAFRNLKAMGFSDARLGVLSHRSEAEVKKNSWRSRSSCPAGVASDG